MCAVYALMVVDASLIPRYALTGDRDKLKMPIMALSRKTYGLLNRITTGFLLLGGFLVVFFTTGKLRAPYPSVTELPKGTNVVYADAPQYSQGSYYGEGGYYGQSSYK